MTNKRRSKPTPRKTSNRKNTRSAARQDTAARRKWFDADVPESLRGGHRW